MTMDAMDAIGRLRRRLVAAIVTALAAATIALAAPARAADAPVLLVVGDSISAGLGVPPGAGWTDLLAARLKERGHKERVVNASISGDTTSGGRARLPALLARHKPSIVVIELGGNDALRGGDLAATRANLDAMIAAARGAGAKVLVVGMRLPPNYGPAYTRRFDAMFADAARAGGAALVPFFFEGFGEDRDFFQPDGIHPTEAAQPKLLDNVWRELAKLVARR
jgi:acyl-CoA thioesterase-1